MIWLAIANFILSLATLGELQKHKKETMANITDVTGGLADLKAVVDSLVAAQKAHTEATIAAALDGVVSQIASIKGDVAAVIPAPVAPVAPVAPKAPVAPVTPPPAAPIVPPIVPPVVGATPAK